MQTDFVSLNRLKIGQKGRVQSLISDGKERRRMQDLGLTEGTVVEAVQRSPMGDPIAYYIRGAVIALRQEDAQKILIQHYA